MSEEFNDIADDGEDMFANMHGQHAVLIEELNKKYTIIENPGIIERILEAGKFIYNYFASLS